MYNIFNKSGCLTFLKEEQNGQTVESLSKFKAEKMEKLLDICEMGMSVSCLFIQPELE